MKCLAWEQGPGFLTPRPGLFCYFFCSHRKSCWLTLERGEGRERGRERNIDLREKHWLVTSCTCPDQGPNPKPRPVTSLGIDPVNFQFTGRQSHQLSLAGPSKIRAPSIILCHMDKRALKTKQQKLITVKTYEACPEKVQPLLMWWAWFAWHRCSLAAKESGLECACVNSGDFTVLVSGGGRCHWVSICTVWLSHSKWLSEWSNKSASNFVLSLNIPPYKQFIRFRRLLETMQWGHHK